MIRPELTVAAICEQNGRFLVVEEEVRGQRVLNQPAGHVEPGETLEQAVSRETREETAWAFRPTALVGMYLWASDGSSRPPILRAAFCGECNDHYPRQTLDDGIIATHWLSYRQLVDASIELRSPLVLRAVDDYLHGVRLPLGVMQRLEAMEAA